MAESSVIREFLVALGFKSDESALKKFDDGIEKATKTVLGLATAIEATAIAVSVGVTRLASNLEALYFASIKTGASAANLKAFDRAAQNLGTQAGEALQSVQGLARFLRNNPGGEGLLAGLGVQTRKANGELQDTTDMMLGLAQRFAQMPYFIANQFASQLGISEDTLRAMRSPGFADEMERMRKRMENIDWKKATEESHAFMMKMRDLQTVVEALGLQVYNALSKRLGVGVEQLADWLSKNGPRIADRVAEIIVKVLDVAEKVGRWIAWLVGKFIEWDKATDGWSTRILGLLAVLKFFGGAEIIGGILKLAAAFITLGGSMTTAAAGGTGLLGTLGKLGLATGVGAAGVGLGWGLTKLFPNNPLAKLGEKIGGAFFEYGDRFNEAIRTFENFGWSRAQAIGIVANLKAESGLHENAEGDNGKAYGIAQWHPDRQEAFKRWAGKDIRESSREEQYAFINYEMREGSEQLAGKLLRAARNERQAAEVTSRYYERPAAADAEARRRGEMAVSIAQETNIHMHGGGDPQAAGRAVASEQGRVNAELTRNFQMAVQ